jgi:hypothetical protein
MSDEQHHDDPRNKRPIEDPERKLSDTWWAARSPEVRARRCRAHRRNGNQCGKVAMAGQQVCGTHGGRAPQAIAKARKRIDEAADRMAARLLAFAEREDVPAYVALQATESALNRAGLAAPTQVNVGLTAPWEEVITGIAHITQAESRARRGLPAEPPLPALSSPGDGDRGDIVDAEVVEEPPSGPPYAQSRPAWGQEPPEPGTGLQTLDDALDGLRQMQKRRW